MVVQWGWRMADASKRVAKDAEKGAPEGRRTEKYRRRQDEIIRAAIELINRKGVRAMTLADVAARLGIVPTGVIYYFSSKEELAAACFLRAIEAYQQLIEAAIAGRDRRDRLERFVAGYVELTRDVALGKREPLTFFNDVRALADPGVNAAYTAMFRQARALLGSSHDDGAERQAFNAVTHLVLSQLFWSVAWLPLYDVEDYERAGERLFDILERGLAGASAG